MFIQTQSLKITICFIYEGRRDHYVFSVLYTGEGEKKN